MPRPIPTLVTTVLFAGAAAHAHGQTTVPLEVGAVAPGFALTGASDDGLADAPVRLGDFAGKTVVLAFFYRARTKG
jgi:hypothetical protein